MTGLNPPSEWRGTSSDPNDEQFGDVVEPISELDDDRLSEFDAVLLGEPFDHAVIGRKGAADGPAALRESLAGVKTHHFDAGPVGNVGDAGDLMLMLDSDEPNEVTTRLLQQEARILTNRLHDADALPVFLGGDNSFTYPNAAPLLEDGSLGVVNFDAHLDVREVRDDPTSGTPYRQLFDAGLDAYACVGARHFETSSRYADTVRESGGEVVTAEEVGDDAVSAIDTALESLDDVDAIYVSVDLDVLDAAFAPGVSAPTPGGISPRELFRMLRLAASDDRVAGFEVVECAPSLDRDDRTVNAGARAIAHFLSAVGGGQ
ncbi:formiminoglutamase [Haladaptatus paucihalophilus DX253]|uniref:Formimidoylglutamase n=1 Tax=Haladaptatus paucihalophilus DX253 TaxID=797209 RepID=E7QP05_HALPU|nr:MULTISPECIES: formimidoylglutamase [Haladaptatus]EFW93658.1 formiminoglutamase [Haladaptatus paucihalophilus DX253]GKZ14992.1 formimidoylglutamase [Haladaptatus sp. T7]SHL46897.1 formiminoglutamase [Haladaptatus paucihalophilus DX253]